VSPDQPIGEAERQTLRLRNGIVSVALLVVLLVSVALAVPALGGVTEAALDAAPGWLLLAVLLEIASCLSYVALVRLVLPNGPARQVRWLAWAEMAFGVLLPVGGAGGLALGAWAMRAWGLGWSRIANRSAVMLLLTGAVNAIMLAVAGIGVAAGLSSGSGGILLGVAPAVVALAILVFFWLLPRRISAAVSGGRHGRVSRGLRHAAAWVGNTEAILRVPAWRQLGNVGYVAFDLAALWACLHAVGIAPPVLALVVAYQLGYLASVVPVPGGLGVLDGGLIGALLLFGLPVGPTAAAVVLYHAIALSVPIPGGIVGFTRLRRAITGERAAQRDRALILPSFGETTLSPTQQY
jgi:uncharacterized membrane protein YbhN (UPF0104 family)